MEVLGEGGVLVCLLGRIGCVCGRILRGVGGSYVITQDLKWVMVPRLCLDEYVICLLVGGLLAVLGVQL
jgi:hypothetical protein